ncbi:MAG: UDP-N-acetylmuramoyl-L-alanyl-D-glutamate--2,6-diaminopimelate ligase [Pseudomonadota bacterium]
MSETETVNELRRLAPAAQGMTADSRRVGRGDVFLAYPGGVHDGRGHIAGAIHAGAAAIAWEPEGFSWDPAWTVPHLPVAGLKARAAGLAAAWHGEPSKALWMTGITGTNGKTSISHWLAQAFTHLGRRTAAVGTLGNGFPGEMAGATHTTPDAVTLQGLLAQYRDAGAAGVAMEVSSHGLDQGRVAEVAFDVAVLTNLSRDHLDYHGSMEAYAAAKARLFHWPGLKAAVVNADDDLGAALMHQVKDARVISYGLKAGDLRADLQADRLGLRLEIVSPWGGGHLESPLLGAFNGYNLLAALGALLAADIPMADALAALATVRAAAGRMQTVEGFPGAPTVIVDFAHTPDALEKVLAALRPLTRGRLVCVFGCGGGRDTGKRPLMGAAVAAGADRAVVTSDNPRNEDPAHIVRDILAGMPAGENANHSVILDRREAIQTAIRDAGAEDIVLLAGKGHEDYQEIQGVKRPFSDLAEAQAALAQWRPA